MFYLERYRSIDLCSSPVPNVPLKGVPTTLNKTKI